MLFDHLQFFLGEIRRKSTPTGTLIMPTYVMSRPSFRVCAFKVYLSAACVRECAFAGATLPVSPDTCFLSAWASSCGHQTETLWSRSHCFLYDCLRGRFPPTRWLYYVSHIVSDIRGSLCLSLLHYNTPLALKIRRHAKMFKLCCWRMPIINDMVVFARVLWLTYDAGPHSLLALNRHGSSLPTFFSLQRLCPQSTQWNLSA